MFADYARECDSVAPARGPSTATAALRRFKGKVVP